MGKPPVKVLFGIPTEGNTQAAPLHSLLAMSFHHGKLMASGEFEFYLGSVGRLFTPMARERLLYDALANGMDYLMMVDDDMVCPYDLFNRLYRHQVDVVTALAFARNPPYGPVIYRIQEGWDPIQRAPFVKTEWVKSYPKDKLIEVDASGFGAVLIDMKHVPKVPRPWFMSACGTGEDILYCIRARKAGARVFMDTSAKIGHLSHPLIVDETTSDAYNDPAWQEKTFGAYERNKVFDVLRGPVLPKDADGCDIMAGTGVA